MIWKKSQRVQSHWREFNYMFNQVQRAIEPFLSLQSTVENWKDIIYGLAEAPRKRKQQLDKMKLLTQTS